MNQINSTIFIFIIFFLFPLNVLAKNKNVIITMTSNGRELFSWVGKWKRNENGEIIINSKVRHSIFIIHEEKDLYSLKTKTNKRELILSGKLTKNKDGFSFKSFEKESFNFVFEDYCKELVDSKDWQSPFKENSLKNRLVGKYGDYRTTHKKGHLHSGVDLKGGFKEYVYPVSNGCIVLISKNKFNSTVLIRHNESGNELYSRYTHLGRIIGRIGETKKNNDTIGMLFNQKTFKASKYKNNHVHLEIRKNFDDFGKASSFSMDKKALDQNCTDPEKFFRTKWKN